MRPEAIEVRVDPETVLRGQRWRGRRPQRILLVHEPGADLDAWGPLPASLAAAGFEVWSIDQRGHGLSDGEPDPDRTVADLSALCAKAVDDGVALGLVTAGATAAAALRLGREDGVHVQVMLSPVGLPEAPERWRELPATTARLVIVGGFDREARAATESLFRQVPGGALWGTVSVVEQGTSLLRSRLTRGIQGDIRVFLRRHLPSPAPPAGSSDE